LGAWASRPLKAAKMAALPGKGRGVNACNQAMFSIDKHKNTGLKYGQKLILTVRRVRKVADTIRKNKSWESRIAVSASVAEGGSSI